MVWVVLLLLLFINFMLLARIRVISQELKRQKARSQKLGLDFSELSQELKALLNADLALDKRIKTLSAQLESLDARQDRIEQGVQKDSAYQQAIKLLEHGEPAEEVMSTCNLSKAEVDLLCNLNGYQTLKQVYGSSE